MLTELKKPECNVFHSNDYAETDITNVSIQSFLKCLIYIYIFHHKKILGSFIYAKPLLLHAFTGCDTTSPIKRR